MKIALIDLETTGLDPFQHEIIEVGCVVFDTKALDQNQEFSCKVKPSHPETGDQKAYKVNGYNEEEWKDAIQIEDALEFLQKSVDGCTFMAYNMCFDWMFLDVAYRRAKMRNPFSYHKLDLLSIAWSKFKDHPSLSLKVLCEECLGLKAEESVHRALNGAKCAFEAYKKLTELP